MFGREGWILKFSPLPLLHLLGRPGVPSRSSLVCLGGAVSSCLVVWDGLENPGVCFPSKFPASPCPSALLHPPLPGYQVPSFSGASLGFYSKNGFFLAFVPQPCYPRWVELQVSLPSWISSQQSVCFPASHILLPSLWRCFYPVFFALVGLCFFLFFKPLILNSVGFMKGVEAEISFKPLLPGSENTVYKLIAHFDCSLPTSSFFYLLTGTLELLRGSL